MTIKEVCEKYNLSPDTLRYYERVGVIPEVTRTSGGIRDYQEVDIGWVENADSDKIGIIGICGWGGMALNAAAIDTRIKATLTSTLYGNRYAHPASADWIR